MKEKDMRISIIRLISLLMIISCHILQGLHIWLAFWLNLGVQIFFFMSGYLYGKKDIMDLKKFYEQRILKILLPSSILIFIMIVIDKLCFDIEYSKIFLSANLLGFGGFYGTLFSLTHTWFVSYILICYFITPFLQNLFKKQKSSAKILFLFLFILLLFYQFRVINVNCAWLGNYILGYYFSRCCIAKKQKKRFFEFLVLFAIPIVPISIILQYDLVTNIPKIFVTYKELICNWEHVLLGSILFLLLYKLFSKIHIHDSFIFKMSDQYSYFIYLVHQIFILNHMSVLKITDYLALNIILIFFLSITSGIFLYWIYHWILKGFTKIEKFKFI